MELEIDCLTSRILLQKVCSYKCQFCTKVCASSRLVSQVHIMAGQNIKKNYLMCEIPIKMLKQHAIPNSVLHNLKIYSSKGCRKTSQIKVKMNLLTPVILNIRIFSRRYFEFLLDTDEYYRICYKVNNAKTFKNLVYYFTLCAHKS